MSLHADLLEQADHLTRREARRPRQASLRRAVSTAYYALFHLITTEAAAVIGPNLSPGRRASTQRWFSHNEMKKVCSLFQVSSFSKPPSLAGLAPSANLRLVARNFVSLQGARYSADYDLSSSWTRWSTEEKVTLARDAFAAWAAIRTTEEANIFILALLLWKNFEIER